jgi:hypothetical protein
MSKSLPRVALLWRTASRALHRYGGAAVLSHSCASPKASLPRATVFRAAQMFPPLKSKTDYHTNNIFRSIYRTF